MGRFNLGTLEARFDAEATRIAGALAVQRPGGALEIEMAEYGLVALQDAWSRFIRDLIIRSSLGNAVTSAGTVIRAGQHGVMRQRDALDLLRRGWSKKGMPSWWEPYWYRVDASTKAITILGPGNGGNIAAAIGSSANPVEDLRLVRNFAVHRLPSTAEDAGAVARGNSSAPWRQPRDIVGATARGGLAAEVLFDSWCRRLRVVAAAAVK